MGRRVKVEIFGRGEGEENLKEENGRKGEEAEERFGRGGIGKAGKCGSWRRGMEERGYGVRGGRRRWAGRGAMVHREEG